MATLTPGWGPFWVMRVATETTDEEGRTVGRCLCKCYCRVPAVTKIDDTPLCQRCSDDTRLFEAGEDFWM